MNVVSFNLLDAMSDYTKLDYDSSFEDINVEIYLDNVGTDFLVIDQHTTVLYFLFDVFSGLYNIVFDLKRNIDKAIEIESYLRRFRYLKSVNYGISFDGNYKDCDLFALTSCISYFGSFVRSSVVEQDDSNINKILKLCLSAHTTCSVAAFYLSGYQPFRNDYNLNRDESFVTAENTISTICSYVNDIINRLCSLKFNFTVPDSVNKENSAIKISVKCSISQLLRMFSDSSGILNIFHDMLCGSFIAYLRSVKFYNPKTAAFSSVWHQYLENLHKNIVAANSVTSNLQKDNLSMEGNKNGD